MRVGGFVKVRITTDTHNDALAVPKTALVEEGGLRSVFVAEADTVRKVEINTGLYDEELRRGARRRRGRRLRRRWPARAACATARASRR